MKRGADILEEAGRLTSGADPNYIRDAQPDSLFEALPLAAARQGCRRYADKGSNYPERRAARAERACRPYLNSIGYGSPPALTKPFDGGQCPVRYQVFATSQGADLTIGGQTPLNVLGPLSAPVRGTQLIGSPFPDSTRYTFTFPSDPANVVQFIARASFNPAPGYRIAGRVDGQPDSCGNPPADYTPPKPPALPGPKREPFEIAPNIDVDISVEVNIDGSIDIDFGTGPIKIDPFDEPEGGGDGGGSGDDPLPPGFQGEPGAPVDVGPGGVADETDPTRNLIGVLVQTIETPARANQVFNQTETYTKGAYFVYFGGNAGLALNPEGAITVEDQFFYAPEGANRFRVVPNVGFTLRVIPFYEEDT